jgi:crossover junction endodeoxyribonuclease RuvC
MRVIGVDPGFAICGWAVAEKGFKLIDYGSIETKASMPIDERLFVLFTGLNDVVQRYKPEAAAIERLFFAKNTKTALDVSKAVGVILLGCRINALPYHEYTPLQVKQALTGFGRADKEQMQFMVMKLYSLKEIPRPDDAADALAIATCRLLAN